MIEGNPYVCRGGCWESAPAVDAGGGYDARGDLDGGGGCVYRGHTYALGATLNAGDGCNTCTCGSGGTVVCTKKACACDPAKETNRRRYLGTSPGICQLIDFACSGTTTLFENACGCGCEQDPSCPEFFDCMPPKPCNGTSIKARCPYSMIAS